MFGATISGRVTDAESGRPLANVEVRGENVLDRSPGANARAGDDGRYILRGLAPGSYRILAEADEAAYIQQYYNNRLGWDSADVVVVRAAEVIEDFNFVLEIGGTISGVVSDKVTGLRFRVSASSLCPPSTIPKAMPIPMHPAAMSCREWPQVGTGFGLMTSLKTIS